MKHINAIRILLTENCNGSCSFCFNKDLRENKDMDTNQAIKLFDRLAIEIKNLKIMGGEPTIHPDFIMLYEHTQKRFKSVFLFTNALNDVILNIKPREEDAITYNISFINKNFNFNKILPDYDFVRSFETVVGTKTNIDDLLSKINFIIGKFNELKIKKRPRFSITLNCMENIFKHKQILNRKWRRLVVSLNDIDPKLVDFDHSIPVCFWTKESIELFKRTELPDSLFSTCRRGDYGLINSDFELLYCNQHPIKLANILELLNKNSSTLFFDKLNTILSKAYMEKLIKNLNTEECKNCMYAITHCTGGCFKHKYP